MIYYSYNDIDYNYLYKSSLRLISLKQDYNIKNNFVINIPAIKFSFNFLRKSELNSLKIYNHLAFLWFLTKKKAKVSKLKMKLDRGIKYYKFSFSVIIYDNELILNFFNLLFNKIFYLLEKKNIKKYFNLNYFFFIIKDLELFSNIRVHGSFFTPKINDNLNLFFFFNKISCIKMKHFLYLFKLDEY